MASLTKFSFSPETNLNFSKAEFLLDNKQYIVHGFETDSPLCYTSVSNRSYKGALQKVIEEKKIKELVKIVQEKMA